MRGRLRGMQLGIHLLQRETARSTAMRYWRQVGAVSLFADEAAVATYSVLS